MPISLEEAAKKTAEEAKRNAVGSGELLYKSFLVDNLSDREKKVIERASDILRKEEDQKKITGR